MKRIKRMCDDRLAEATCTLIVAWAAAKADKDRSARIVRRAAETKSIWIQIEAAKLFLFLGEEYRQEEIACLKRAFELSGEKDP